MQHSRSGRGRAPGQLPAYDSPVPLFEGRTRGEAHVMEVVEECRRRLREEPGDAAAALRLADALAASGQGREGVQVLNRVGPRLQKAGKLVEAIAVYKKVEELDPKAEVTSSFLSHIALKQILEAASKAASPAAPPATEVAERRKKKERVQALTRGIPLLKDIPPFLFELVLEKIHLRTALPGETLFREGDEGSSILFVAAGEVLVTARGDSGEPVLLGTLGPGDVAGEISFLSGVPRTATLVVRTRAELLELDRNAIAPIARKHRNVAEALSRLYSERVLDGVLARSRLFGRLPRPDREALARRLRPVTAKPGDVLVKEGAADAGVFLVRRGAVRVTARRGTRDVALALLTPHDFFGDVATVRAGPRTASVTAVAESELLWLSGPDLLALLAQRPEISAALEEIQLERFVKNARTLEEGE